LRELVQRIGPKEHFVGISNHALPAEIANLIHNLRGTRTPISQIPAVKNQIGRRLPQIRQDRLKRRSIAVDVRYDCDAHISP